MGVYCTDSVNVQLDNVTIGENVVAADSLAVEGDAAPDAGTFELVFELVMDAARELGHSGPEWHRERSHHIGWFSGLFSVNPDDAEELEEGGAKLGETVAALGADDLPGEAVLRPARGPFPGGCPRLRRRILLATRIVFSE